MLKLLTVSSYQVSAATLATVIKRRALSLCVRDGRDKKYRGNVERKILQNKSANTNINVILPPHLKCNCTLGKHMLNLCSPCRSCHNAPVVS